MQEADTLKKLLQRRRSHFPKNYIEGEIPLPILGEILDSAKFAPQHKKTSPARLRLFVADEKDRLAAELATLYKEHTRPEVFLQKKYEDIPQKIGKAAAIITLSVNYSGLVPRWEEIASVAMSVQNMYLTCTAHHLGCYWSTLAQSTLLGSFLNLTEEQECLGLFYVGNIL